MEESRDQPLQALIYQTGIRGPQGVGAGPVLLKTGVAALEGKSSMLSKNRKQNPNGLARTEVLFAHHLPLSLTLLKCPYSLPFQHNVLSLAKLDGLFSGKMASSCNNLLLSFSTLGCQLPMPTGGSSYLWVPMWGGNIAITRTFYIPEAIY